MSGTAPILEEIAADFENAPWPEPNRDFLRRTATPPPALPVVAFRSWAAWLENAAEATNAPVDYVALPLIVAASSLIGNARWAEAWPGWAEPPVVWGAAVGDPSSGKTSGAGPIVRDVLGEIEQYVGRDFPEAMRQWTAAAEIASAVEEQWRKDVARAIKNNPPPPPRPDAANPPPKPVLPRVRVIDATIEKLAEIVASTPKGVVCFRDELAAWLLNLQRYANGGSDRPFWLEAYNGGAMQIDRVKNPVPVFVPHLTVALFGTVQPDRLEEVFRDADDGLCSRFLWTWPAPRPFRRPTVGLDTALAVSRLRRLADLSMDTGDGGKPRPRRVPLDEEGQEVLERFARKMQEREAGAAPLLRSSLGKARGQALRLALVLEFLWWTAQPEGTPEPRLISAAAMRGAAGLLDAYFLPMAERVFGDAAISADERNARTLAEWIIKTKPEAVNVSTIRDTARLPGLRESEAVRRACQFLVDAFWLRPAPLSGAPGRPRGDYLINPRLYEEEAAP